MYTDAGVKAVWLVTGCSRGIGIEWVRQILRRGDSCIATCRDPEAALRLQEVLKAHKPADGAASSIALCLPLDVADEGSIRGLPELLRSNGVEKLDILIHNAGISAPTHPVDPVATASKDAMMRCYETNCVGPLLLTQALLPHLEAGRDKKVLAVSTDMASCTLTTHGGSVSYRASKAGLNMAWRCLAGELHDTTGLVFTMVHPGWVHTDMGAAGGRAPPVTPSSSVEGMITVVDSMSDKFNGAFLDWEGNTRPF